ncbi:CoA pyrophosphatase [Blastococcus sp. CCUG 61487]|uniref:NUDIX hydrolase n=1 Tax=Blastococcus sp. CCUG 61487 TaxID=1840703 RepID=UPI001133A6D5|nr:CoA pyrophosphatase [Blastococcus sp. CCUG 61487]TKJ18139.1 coenzyme A pyrophosphatase [Blastococcus sp. CCUG 61487]
MSAPLRPPGTDGLPDYLVRLLDGAHDLPLARRMPRPAASARKSAVLILFGEGPVGPDLVFIEKSAHLRTHAGQPAFPGGGVEHGDDFPIGTALREAQEEAGIDPEGVRVLATLQELYLPPSDRLVVPVVGWWDDPREVTVGDPHEVARVARVPLDDLVDPANRYRLRHPSGYIGPAFGVADMEIWGFTAGLVDAILDAAGLARPWNTRDVRSMGAPRLSPYTLPGSGDDDPAGDAAAPTVADPAPDGPPTRTVPPR